MQSFHFVWFPECGGFQVGDMADFHVPYVRSRRNFFYSDIWCWKGHVRNFGSLATPLLEIWPFIQVTDFSSGSTSHLHTTKSVQVSKLSNKASSYNMWWWFWSRISFSMPSAKLRWIKMHRNRVLSLFFAFAGGNYAMNEVNDTQRTVTIRSRNKVLNVQC